MVVDKVSLVAQMLIDFFLWMCWRWVWFALLAFDISLSTVAYLNVGDNFLLANTSERLVSERQPFLNLSFARCQFFTLLGMCSIMLSFYILELVQPYQRRVTQPSWTWRQEPWWWCWEHQSFHRPTIVQHVSLSPCASKHSQHLAFYL